MLLPSLKNYNFAELLRFLGFKKDLETLKHANYFPKNPI